MILLACRTEADLQKPSWREQQGPPSGLTIVDWSQIRAEYERHSHAAIPDGDAHEALYRR